MGEPVSEYEMLDMTADQARRLVEGVTPDPVPTPERAAELLAQLPQEPATPITVVTSLRLPLDLKHRVDAAAAADGVSASAFIRRALERVMSGQDTGNLVNLDDVIAAVRSLPHAA